MEPLSEKTIFAAIVVLGAAAFVAALQEANHWLTQAKGRFR